MAARVWGWGRGGRGSAASLATHPKQPKNKAWSFTQKTGHNRTLSAKDRGRQLPRGKL